MDPLSIFDPSYTDPAASGDSTAPNLSAGSLSGSSQGGILGALGLDSATLKSLVPVAASFFGGKTATTPAGTAVAPGTNGTTAAGTVAGQNNNTLYLILGAGALVALLFLNKK